MENVMHISNEKVGILAELVKEGFEQASEKEKSYNKLKNKVTELKNNKLITSDVHDWLVYPSLSNHKSINDVIRNKDSE
tara:strand:- start:394 stop:630 length:237 start_codon:yes stop_codon:yes gene_type:complete